MPSIILASFWVGLGGALGSIARFWISGIIAHRFGEIFPWGTLSVNVTGSFLIGLISGLGDPESRLLLSPNIRQFFLFGILGGYTTFSSFSLQTFSLLLEGEWLYALGNIFLSVFLCLGAVTCGYLLASYLSD